MTEPRRAHSAGLMESRIYGLTDELHSSETHFVGKYGITELRNQAAKQRKYGSKQHGCG